MSASNMLQGHDDVRAEIVRRALALGISDDPGAAAHALGTVIIDGREVNAHVMHAVDPIITDGKSVMFIKRTKEPRKGLRATPGGMIDPGETDAQAAIREGGEELKEVQSDCKKIPLPLEGGERIGRRNFNRPYDIRIAYNEKFADRGVHKGDVFLVSSQAFRFDVPDLASRNIIATDDAQKGSAELLALPEIARLGRAGLGDHYDLVEAALPEYFAKRALVNKLQRV